MHSLIDNHSEVSTLPSIYLSQFFDNDNWNKITLSGWNGIIEKFIQNYPVLFDSRSSYPIQSIGGRAIESIGVKEGMTSLGNSKNEFLYIEKKVFKKELENLMSQHSSLDQITFFRLIHIAYEKAIKKLHNKKIIFYHMHNPDTSAKLNFIRLAPESKWLIMVRDPVENCESWISQYFLNNSYKNISTRIVRTLFDIDDVLFKKHDAVGLRIEDLKKKPIETMFSLCNWMGINHESNLYNMTAQGKRWWGDLSSHSNSAFGKKQKINRYKIFSKNDKFILNTLFYPFRVKFGYTKEDFNKFKNNLNAINPMIDDIFDFEKKLLEKRKIKKNIFVKSGHSLYFRSRLRDRWNILNKTYTYPNLLNPLKIKRRN